MPKAQKSNRARHEPLHVQLAGDDALQKYGRVSKPGKRQKPRTDAVDDAEVILDPKTSRKIFELAKHQQEELHDNEEDEDDLPDEVDRPAPRAAPRQDSDSENEWEDEKDVDEEEYAELEIDEGDMQMLDALLPSNTTKRKTLADMILNKIEGADDAMSDTPASKKRRGPDEAPDPAEGLDPKVVEVYTRIGQLLASYKSGPLPKLFKLLPSLPQWARLLALTTPEKWTPHAARAATRIFISNLKPTQARVFLEGVLLPAVRENIADSGGRLNVHLYEALKKAVYKPAAFFKGVLFPLAEQACTLREAAILSSVLARVSIPIMHSAAALGRLAQMDYSGPTSLFIRVLLDKKYALPYKVLDRLWEHFVRLSNTYRGRADRGEAERLPVLWHQSLLVFVQRYAAFLTPDQKDALLDVIRNTPHPQISPEIRRELVASASRPPAGQDVEMAT